MFEANAKLWEQESISVKPVEHLRKKRNLFIIYILYLKRVMVT